MLIRDSLLVTHVQVSVPNEIKKAQDMAAERGVKSTVRVIGHIGNPDVQTLINALGFRQKSLVKVIYICDAVVHRVSGCDAASAAVTLLVQ